MINYKRLIYIDIETTSQHKNWTEFENSDTFGADTFRLKYIRAQRNNNQQWIGSLEESYINNAPLLSEYGKIVCISYGFFNKGEFTLVTKSTKDFPDEKDLMEYVAKIFSQAETKGLTLCGHNIKGFDLPFIFKKMLKYSIQIPNNINIVGKKPWEVNIYDTGELLKGTGSITTSLSDATYLLELDSPKDDMNGSEVHKVYWEDNDIERICRYCEKDVTAVKEIVVRLFECLGESF